jgi:hypothetical protein
MMDERGSHLCFRPFRPRVELFGVLVPPTLVCNCNLCKIVIEVEVRDELLDTPYISLSPQIQQDSRDSRL